MINRVTLTGRLTRDPELRYTSTGVPVASFTLAVQRNYTNQQGQREADFIQCQVWRRTAENVANYLRKGSLVAVDGRLQSRSYETQDGRRVYVTEVVADTVQFLGSAGRQNPNPQYPPYGNQPARNYGNNRGRNDDPFSVDRNQPSNDNPFEYSSGMPIDISDDDLPF